MSNNYKGQFTEWSPAYPVVFHGLSREVSERAVINGGFAHHLTMDTHNITINAIQKAGGYE